MNLFRYQAFNMLIVIIIYFFLDYKIIQFINLFKRHLTLPSLNLFMFKKQKIMLL